MFEWWQTLFLSATSLLIGGGIAITSGYLQHKWTTRAGRDAEERAARRRAQEMEEQARRAHRKERIGPVLDFLDIAKQFIAQTHVAQMAELTYEEDKFGVREKGLTLEEWTAAVMEGTPGPTDFELTRSISVAGSSAPTPEIQQALYTLTQAMPTTIDWDEKLDEFKAALRVMEKLIEDYLVQS